MARGTPRRAHREPVEGTLFPSDALARNVRAYRAVRGLKQEDLGRRMDQLGHEWTAGIVGFVERGARAVSVDELVGLAICLGVPLGALVDPTGPDGREPLGLDIAGGSTEWSPVLPEEAHYFARGKLVFRLVQELTEGTGVGVLAAEPEPGFEQEWETVWRRRAEEHERTERERS